MSNPSTESSDASPVKMEAPKELPNGKEIVDIAAQIPSANTILLGMFKLDLKPLAPRLLQNREAYIDYLKYTQEQADILREIVEQAKAKQPLDNELDFACIYLLAWMGWNADIEGRGLGELCTYDKMFSFKET
ncbi:hypothetical protein Tco_0771618 [Tanacetum coccineum]|uniref:Uncharacterized protein n=1 Tax=Tanacetum coccineum TaxID=301880 RepID=A0ABQ4ZGL9_9ASTR